MKIDGRIPWNAAAICETFKISFLMGRRHYERRFESNHFKDLLIPFGSLV